ncbi:MAG TPA: hypothetical protein VGG34_01800 [Opitutaceae bacterium]
MIFTALWALCVIVGFLTIAAGIVGIIFWILAVLFFVLAVITYRSRKNSSRPAGTPGPG